MKPYTVCSLCVPRLRSKGLGKVRSCTMGMQPWLWDDSDARSSITCCEIKRNTRCRADGLVRIVAQRRIVDAGSWGRGLERADWRNGVSRTFGFYPQRCEYW